MAQLNSHSAFVEKKYANKLKPICLLMLEHNLHLKSVNVGTKTTRKLTKKNQERSSKVNYSYSCFVSKTARLTTYTNMKPLDRFRMISIRICLNQD